ncbi:MAG: hypothetical protein WCJ39_10890, partial [bacterium]
SGKLVDVSKQFPILFTRSLFEFPLVKAHIDHLWLSSGVQLDGLQSIGMPGSDHKAYLFDISPE